MIANLSGQLRMSGCELLQGSTVRDGMREPFLAIDVLTCLQSRLANGEVPMIRRRDDYGTDSGLFVEQFAIVVIRLDVGQPDRLERTVALPLVDIANGDNLLIDLGEFRDERTAHLATHANTRRRKSLIGGAVPPGFLTEEWWVDQFLAAAAVRKIDDAKPCETS